ncbi:anti-sigma factor family protein [Chitinophagaceae bacterium LWZ2-11]
MRTNHLNEEELQAYALDPEQTALEFRSHIQDCKTCARHAEAYRAMFDALKTQQRPVFKFDLSGAVLKQLPEKRTERVKKGLLLYGCALAAFGILGLLSFCFRQHILYWFEGVSEPGLLIIVSTAVVIGWFQIKELYRKYHRQLTELDFYSN